MAQTGRPGPRRSLAESDILAAAVGLLDRGGAAALSMRGVAAAVGVAPNALYTYFRTKTALLHAVTDELLGRVDLDHLGDPTRPWRDRLVRYALDVRSTLLAHPGSAPLLLNSPLDGPHALTAGEALLGVLDEAGLDRADAARASYLLLTYVLGTVAFDVAELEPGTDPLDDGTRTTARRAALTVPAERYPRTAAGIDVIAAYTSTGQYLWGLHRLLDGLDPLRSAE
ncbi:MAG: TetR/AcrR family transcriptional regulator, tetracycline repressor protein [Actinomycetota bacterium]|jgi:AcrR family transcriptional regulator|nr:TetR/AcrR family transcriptional regulator, tetracycline repressor protein [Actinomycetota bacterium]